MERFLDAIGVPFFQRKWVIENRADVTDAPSSRPVLGSAGPVQHPTSCGHLIRCLNWAAYCPDQKYAVLICDNDASLEFLSKSFAALQQPCFALHTAASGQCSSRTVEALAVQVMSSIRSSFASTPAFVGGVGITSMQVAYEVACRCHCPPLPSPPLPSNVAVAGPGPPRLCVCTAVSSTGCVDTCLITRSFRLTGVVPSSSLSRLEMQGSMVDALLLIQDPIHHLLTEVMRKPWFAFRSLMPPEGCSDLSRPSLTGERFRQACSGSMGSFAEWLAEFCPPSLSLHEWNRCAWPLPLLSVQHRPRTVFFCRDLKTAHVGCVATRAVRELAAEKSEPSGEEMPHEWVSIAAMLLHHHGTLSMDSLLAQLSTGDFDSQMEALCAWRKPEVPEVCSAPFAVPQACFPPPRAA